jgi:hypothetical protein
LIADWVNRASSDPAQLEAWEAEFCGCLWGILCGIAFDVIDVDPSGIGWALEHEDDLHTYTQLTRRGGLHLYFQPTPGLRPRTDCPVKGVDVRSTGSIVIDWKRLGFPTIERAMLRMPEWVVEAVIKPATQCPPRGSLVAGNGSNHLPRNLYFRLVQLVPTATRHQQRCIRGLLSVVVNAPDGTRNDQLNWAAFKMRQYVEAGVISRTNAEVLLMEAASGYVATDGKDRAWATIQSGLGDVSDTSLPRCV